MKDTIKSYIEKIRVNSCPIYIVGILLLSVVISASLYSYIDNMILQKCYPSREIEISIIPSDSSTHGDFYIYSFASSKELWDDICTSDKTGAWSFFYTDETNQRWKVSIVDAVQSMKIFRDQYTHEYIDVSSQNETVTVEVTINGIREEYNVGDGDNIINLYNDGLERKVLIINCIVFTILVILISVFLVIILKIFRSNIFDKGFLSTEYGLLSFSIITGLFLIWGYLAFAIGIEEYISCYGDQAFYWSEGNKLNPFIQAKELVLPHRGYLSPWVCTVCIRLGKLFHIPGEIFWILFLSIIHGALFGYVLPRLYVLMSGNNNPRLYQLLLVTIVYMWGPFGYQIMGKLGDAPGLIFFIFSLWALFEIPQKGKLYAFLSGVFISVSISYRMTYKHALYAITIATVVYMISKLIKKELSIKKIILYTVLFSCGLVVVAIPQIYGNLSKGVYDIFPYTFEGPQQALSTATWGVQAGVLVFGYPYGATDYDFIEMGTRAGLRNYGEGYSILNVLSVLSGQWLDTLIYIFKKLFFGFSPVREIAYKSIITGYPNSFPFKHESGFAIVPMFNYVLLGITMYLCIIKKKILSRKEKVVFWCIFLFLLLPQTFTHVEWRYFLPGYVIIYYMVFFRMFDLSRRKLLEGGKKIWMHDVGKLLIFVSIYVTASEALLWTFY